MAQNFLKLNEITYGELCSNLKLNSFYRTYFGSLALIALPFMQLPIFYKSNFKVKSHIFCSIGERIDSL